MQRFTAEFPSLLSGVTVETLEADPHSTYALSPELSLIYLNPAWFRFAKENAGEPAISMRFGLGTPVCAAIAAPLKEFYSGAYLRALETGEAWDHDYECSSADRYRRYHQTVYPLHNRAGLLVVNSLVQDQPHNPETHAPSPPREERYTGAQGLIIQCCHCRRVQRAAEPELWDWVPAWVKRMPLRTSHGLCPICYEYYWIYRAQAR